MSQGTVKERGELIKNEAKRIVHLFPERSTTVIQAEEMSTVLGVRKSGLFTDLLCDVE